MDLVINNIIRSYYIKPGLKGRFGFFVLRVVFMSQCFIPFLTRKIEPANFIKEDRA